MAHAANSVRNALVDGGNHLHISPLAEPGDTADVVGVVVGEKDAAQGKPALGQYAFNRGGFAWIHHYGVAGRVGEKPDVVVDKRRDRFRVQIEHSTGG